MGPVANHEPECPSLRGELSVKVECLPFSRIPHTTRLFLDFLSYSPQIQSFYPRSPSLAEWAKQETSDRRYDAVHRQRVSDALERQNRTWNASPKTLDNITRLRAGASAVVTGQQVGLFGGPLFSILKALTAVKLAVEATAAGVDSVPIFWLATTDHDLAEVNHTLLPGPEASLHPIATASRGLDEAPVGTVTFGPEIEAVTQSVVELLGTTQATDFLRESYRPGETLGSAFARLFSRLFDEFGVILIDPSDPEIHAAAEPVYRAAIERAAELDEALLARGKALDDMGYHQQAKVTPSSTLLFTLRDGARVPIHRRTNGTPATVEFLVRDEKISQDELLRRIAAAPHEFSPNVLLRPVVQDYLLPTLAYTGGAAEVAYFAQAGVVYEKLLGHVTLSPCPRSFVARKCCGRNWPPRSSHLSCSRRSIARIQPCKRRCRSFVRSWRDSTGLWWMPPTMPAPRFSINWKACAPARLEPKFARAKSSAVTPNNSPTLFFQTRPCRNAKSRPSTTSHAMVSNS